MILCFACAGVGEEPALKSLLSPSSFLLQQGGQFKMVKHPQWHCLNFHEPWFFLFFPLQWEVSWLFPKEPFGRVMLARLSQWLGTDPLGSLSCWREGLWNWLLPVKQLRSAGLAVGRLWEAGSVETCLCIAVEGGVWVSRDVLHDGCAGHAVCYLGSVQDRTCFVTSTRTYFLL